MRLSVFISQDVEGASEMELALERLKEQAGLSVEDAALVVRQPDGSSQMSPGRALVGEGHLGGIFWGMFFALLYWSRWWGLNIGSVLSNLSLEEGFVRQVSQAITRHHSALFILATEEETRRVVETLGNFTPETYSIEISEADYRQLQNTFRH